MPQYKLRNSVGEKNESEVVFPLVQGIGKNLRYIATGFFIYYNIFVTAKHVFDEEDIFGNNPVYPFNFRDGRYYDGRRITHLYKHPTSDICIGQLQHGKHRETGKNIRDQVLKICKEGLVVGSKITTYAYPESSITPLNGTMDFISHFYSGKITKHYPTGRDKSLISWPCYETNMLVKSGASGGPVFNLKTGRVAAVNSTGFDFYEEGQNVSHITPISQVLDIEIPDAELFDTAGKFTVRELLLACNCI
jgi:V8-like Glu-specific endopeptidase